MIALCISMLFFAFLHCFSCLDTSNTTNCNAPFTHFNMTGITDKDFCKTKPCIAKCCGEDEILYNIVRAKPVCTKRSYIPNVSNKADLSSLLKFYKNDIRVNIMESTKNLKEDFHWVHSKKFFNKLCAYSFVQVLYKPLENGTLMIDGPNFYDRWIQDIPPLDYCVDFHLIKNEDGTFLTNLYYKILIPTSDGQEGFNQDTTVTDIFSASAMAISCFFMIIVLVVYSLLPQLRSLFGMVLMAYLVSLTLAYALKISELLTKITNRITPEICHILSPFFYFAILSSFFWLNIMSFDIWWTFRGVLKYREALHRVNAVKKFQWCSLYAWGVPALVAIAVTVIDRLVPFDLRFVKPHFDDCFSQHNEIFIYLYVPIIILTIINCVMFLLAISKIWLTHRDISQFNSQGSKDDVTNVKIFLVYIKISVISGISWILEIVQMFFRDIPTWLSIILNAYNVLIGVAIFFLFIFKKSILDMLCKRFGILQHRNRNSTTNITPDHMEIYKRTQTFDAEMEEL